VLSGDELLVRGVNWIKIPKASVSELKMRLYPAALTSLHVPVFAGRAIISNAGPKTGHPAFQYIIFFYGNSTRPGWRRILNPCVPRGSGRTLYTR